MKALEKVAQAVVLNVPGVGASLKHFTLTTAQGESFVARVVTIPTHDSMTDDRRGVGDLRLNHLSLDYKSKPMVRHCACCRPHWITEVINGHKVVTCLMCSKPPRQ